MEQLAGRGLVGIGTRLGQEESHEPRDRCAASGDEPYEVEAIAAEEGLSRDALLQSGVDEADAFVASAGDDRANLLAALNAKQLGADLCMSVVSREEFVPLVDALNIDAAFSPRLITAEAILRFVHTRALRAMHFLRTGFEALELEVEEGSLIVGRQIGRTGGVLHGCRIGAILRGSEVLIARVGTEINAGDRVLMLGVDGTLADLEPVFTASS